MLNSLTRPVPWWGGEEGEEPIVRPKGLSHGCVEGSRRSEGEENKWDDETQSSQIDWRLTSPIGFFASKSYVILAALEGFIRVESSLYGFMLVVWFCFHVRS